MVAGNSEAVVLGGLIPDTQYQLTVAAIWSNKKYRSRAIIFRTLGESEGELLLCSIDSTNERKLPFYCRIAENITTTRLTNGWRGPTSSALCRSALSRGECVAQLDNTNTATSNGTNTCTTIEIIMWKRAYLETCIRLI